MLINNGEEGRTVDGESLRQILQEDLKGESGIDANGGQFYGLGKGERLRQESSVDGNFSVPSRYDKHPQSRPFTLLGNSSYSPRTEQKFLNRLLKRRQRAEKGR